MSDNKRKRIARACDSCNRRKSKCSGDYPTCDNCAAHGRECTYDRGSKKRGPKEQEKYSGEQDQFDYQALNYQSMPQQDHFQEALHQYQNPHAYVEQYNQSPQQDYLITHFPDPIPQQFPPFQQTPQFPQYPQSLPYSTQYQNPQVAVNSMHSIGSRDEIEQLLLNTFFKYVFPVFPAVHTNTFAHNITSQPRILVCSVYAVSTRFIGIPGNDPSPLSEEELAQIGEEYYNEAHDLINSELDLPRWEFILALLMLTFYAASAGKGSVAWIYVSMSVRAAQRLQLDIDPTLKEETKGLSPLEMEIHRRVWWCTFISDQLSAVSANSLPGISDFSAIQVHIPELNSVWDTLTGSHDDVIPSKTRTVQEEVKQLLPPFTEKTFDNGFATFVVLANIFGKITTYAKRSYSDSVDSQKFTELSNMLENFHQALPWRHRNVDWVFSPTNHNTFSWHLLFENFLFNAANILLHRPTLMSMLRQSDANTPVTASPAFSKCLAYADRITDLLEKTLKANPNFNYVNSFSNFCIYQSAFVYLIKAKIDRMNTSLSSQSSPVPVTPPATPQQSESTNPTNKHLTRERSVNAHIEALGRLSIVWKASAGLRDLLIKLTDSVQETWEAGDDRKRQILGGEGFWFQLGCTLKTTKPTDSNNNNTKNTDNDTSTKSNNSTAGDTPFLTFSQAHAQQEKGQTRPLRQNFDSREDDVPNSNQSTTPQLFDLENELLDFSDPPMFPFIDLVGL